MTVKDARLLWQHTPKAFYTVCRFMAVWVVEFSRGGTKLERFLHKNQHPQRKLLNFEFWINGELSKIGHHFSNKLILKCQ